MPERDLQDLIRVYRRDQVVTTALRVIGRSESVDVSMEEIAAEAGVSRSTIYNHFRDRAELLAACADWSYGHLASAMQKSLEIDAPPAELLTRFFEAAFRCLDENPGFYRLATSLRAPATGAEEVLGLHLTMAASQSREQIDRLIDRVMTDADLVADRDTVTAFVGVVLSGSLQRRAISTESRPAGDAAREVAELLLFGLVRR